MGFWDDCRIRVIVKSSSHVNTEEATIPSTTNPEDQQNRPMPNEKEDHIQK